MSDVSGPFGSQTKLIVVGLLVVILLPGIGLALVISYYLVKVTGEDWTVFLLSFKGRVGFSYYCNCVICN